ncbi:3-deoxy-D-manno-octulosonic acid transferase [Sulfuricurvum sp.]|uniref:3-deoxy-D-manno-octulosonic acid transferase n=1 Tax=Sulfuricurvum sp. TaxID=2025608 RepID=UPI002D65D3EC|nr:3-deoxy-D-manno-octulosonic acid transferase [Sulfuricurvum sp.]HZF71581.1 3-deoxy-D-manno-octulosonic acid transferase [Sulfuricurvum sp.]
MQPNILEKNFTFLFTLGLFIGLFFSFLYADHQILMGDHFQMLQKGYLGAKSGIWMGYGNAASVVGNVPGTLSALVIGVPLMLWDSPWAPMVFLIALHLVSFLLFDSVIKHIFNPTIRLVFLLLYWLNPWFLYENMLYNPSYLFVFSALHFWSAYHMRENKSFGYTFLHVLSIAMAMQLHYSWIVLALISFYLYLRGIIKVSWFAILSALIVTIASLIPYFHDYLSHPEIRQNPGNKDGARYIGWGLVHVYPILKAILYWFRYPSFFFSNKEILGTTFDWISSSVQLQKAAVFSYRAIVDIIGVITVWIALKANGYSWKSIKPIAFSRSVHPSPLQWLLLYSVGTFIAILISAGLSPIVFSHWHLIIAFGFALFPILVFVDHYRKNNAQRFLVYLLATFIYFGCINLIAANDGEKFSHKVDYQTQAIEYIQTYLRY